MKEFWNLWHHGGVTKLKTVVAVLIAFLACSNFWLWLNLWNLKNELFEFERRMVELLKELCKQPAEDGPGKRTEKPTDEV